MISRLDAERLRTLDDLRASMGSVAVSSSERSAEAAATSTMHVKSATPNPPEEVGGNRRRVDRPHRSLEGLADRQSPPRENGGVPVESTADPGSMEGHWREAFLGPELMITTASPGETEPSSALADMGYRVDVSRAEPDLHLSARPLHVVDVVEAQAVEPVQGSAGRHPRQPPCPGHHSDGPGDHQRTHRTTFSVRPSPLPWRTQ